jgi:DNA-binding CsgD family transcriptional regulator
MTNAELVIEYVSPNASQVGGWLPSQLEGRNALELIHPEDQLLVAEMLERLRANPAPRDGALELETINVRAKGIGGEWINVVARCANLLDDPGVAGMLVTFAAIGDPLAAAFGELAARLTPREREVVRMVTDGYRVSTIARELGLAASTVRNHLSAIFHKLNVANQSQLVERLAHAAGRG